MFNSKMNLVIRFTIFLSSLVLVYGRDDSFPSYSFAQHPLSTLEEFSTFNPVPVVMKKYHRNNVGDKKLDTRNVFFAPKSASFDRFPSNEPFATGPLDSLVATNMKIGTNIEQYFIHFELNYRCRVFVVSKGLSLEEMRSISNNQSALTVSNVPANWSAPFLLTYNKERQVLQHGPKASDRTKTSFPKYGVAFEIPASSDNKYWIDHPTKLKVFGNKELQNFFFLFADISTSTIDDVRPLPDASLPQPFISPLTKAVVNSQADPAIANDYCPDWLHDLNVVKSRTGGVDIGEPEYWRTWHPMIDPMYWCYYKHEHGSFPGPNYRPQFGYTAYKTEDPTTPTRRQSESHNGFKIITFRAKDDGRFVCFTVHMHLSESRRFVVRHHTAIFAVLGADYDLQAELSMKFDFGFAGVTYEDDARPSEYGNQIVVPRNEIQERIEAEIFDVNAAFRRFNVILIDENYPNSVDRNYEIRTPLPNNPAEYIGIYEKWSGRPTTCVTAPERTSGLTVDVLDPATGMPTKDSNQLTWLKGSSIRRDFKIEEFIFGLQYCSFIGGNLNSFISSDGIFYTDSLFTTLKPGEGDYSVRQFIRTDFQPLVLKAGRLKVCDFWNGFLAYDSQTVGAPEVQQINLDNAIDKRVN